MDSKLQDQYEEVNEKCVRKKYKNVFFIAHLTEILLQYFKIIHPYWGIFYTIFKYRIALLKQLQF